MTIKELNKLIKEELDAFLNEEQTDEVYHEDGSDDIEVTTDEPEEGGEDEALDTLRQIFNMLKPIVEPEDDEDEEGDEGVDLEDADEEGEEEPVDENLDHPNYRADYVKDVAHDAEKIKGGLNESVDTTARFKKLANIK
jgi:hypothetical protein